MCDVNTCAMEREVWTVFRSGVQAVRAMPSSTDDEKVFRARSIAKVGALRKCCELPFLRSFD